MRNEKGQSLFEVVFTLAIAALIITAVVSLATTSIRNSTFARNKSQATRLAQESTEWLREERDKDWVEFANRASSGAGTSWCLKILSWPGAAGTCGGEDFVTATSIFIRETTLILVSSSNIQASIVVSWRDALGLHEVRQVTSYTDWRAE